MKNYIVYSETGSSLEVRTNNRKEAETVVKQEFPEFKIANIFPLKR